MTLAQLAGEIWASLLTLFAGGLASIGGVVTKNHRRSRKNERQLQGDPDDPNAEGVLQLTKRNGEKIDALQERMEEQHEAVLDRVEDLADDVNGES